MAKKIQILLSVIMFFIIIAIHFIYPPHHVDGFVPPIYSAIPFLLILLIIAAFPLIPKINHWWENNQNRLWISVMLGLPVAYYIGRNDPGQLFHTSVEYFQFISLLASLFITAGGLHLAGDLIATPKINNTFNKPIGFIFVAI